MLEAISEIDLGDKIIRIEKHSDSNCLLFAILDGSGKEEPIILQIPSTKITPLANAISDMR